MALDPHEKPPEPLRGFFKRYQTVAKHPKENLRLTLDNDPDIIDFTRGLTETQKLMVEAEAFGNRDEQHALFQEYLRGRVNEQTGLGLPPPVSYKHKEFSGLAIIPSLVPENVQKAMLNRTLHRDLSNPAHKTNVHFHHRLNYSKGKKSFFEYDPGTLDVVVPREASSHTPLSVSQLLSKKLRWITLGGQYDWTEKVYPRQKPPEFPADLCHLLRGLFPKTIPEAAIVNLYSSNDVLSLHRDVSEFCDNGLISLSIGCDGLFIMALTGESNLDGQENSIVVRLRSGDAVYMSGPSRYAWHGVPRIIPGTCPAGLQNWPVDGSDSDIPSQWSNWMNSKRINLNVRQMCPSTGGANGTT